LTAQPDLAAAPGAVASEAKPARDQKDVETRGVTIRPYGFLGLGTRTRLEGEVLVGSILGDNKGGILHTFNPIREVGVRAAGGWAQLHYQVNPRFSVAGGYGLDDTFDDDLSIGFRSKNDVIQGNVFYNISPRLVFGRRSQPVAHELDRFA
jgi:hypothetical protein